MSEPQRLVGGGGMVTAKCADCGATHQVAQVAWDMAMTFHKMLLERGEQGMSGVGRCPPCAEAFEQEQQQRSTADYYRAVDLFRRMRGALARIEQGRVTRQDVARFIHELPDDFVAAHHQGVKSFRARADELFAKRDKHHGVDDDDFGL